MAIAVQDEIAAQHAQATISAVEANVLRPVRIGDDVPCHECLSGTTVHGGRVLADEGEGSRDGGRPLGGGGEGAGRPGR